MVRFCTRLWWRRLDRVQVGRSEKSLDVTAEEDLGDAASRRSRKADEGASPPSLQLRLRQGRVFAEVSGGRVERSNRLRIRPPLRRQYGVEDGRVLHCSMMTVSTSPWAHRSDLRAANAHVGDPQRPLRDLPLHPVPG